MMDRPYHPIAIEVVQLYLDRHSSSVGAHEFGQKLAGLIDNLVQSLQADNTLMQAKVETLFDAIAHGDDQHKAWLKQAIVDHFDGKPVQPVVGKGNKEVLQADNAALRERVEELEGQQLSTLGSWYIFEPQAVAKICDEVLDRSGALLGKVRNHAREARALIGEQS